MLKLLRSLFFFWRRPKSPEQEAFDKYWDKCLAMRGAEGILLEVGEPGTDPFAEYDEQLFAYRRQQRQQH